MLFQLAAADVRGRRTSLLPAAAARSFRKNVALKEKLLPTVNSRTVLRGCSGSFTPRANPSLAGRMAMPSTTAAPAASIVNADHDLRPREPLALILDPEIVIVDIPLLPESPVARPRLRGHVKRGGHAHASVGMPPNRTTTMCQTTRRYFTLESTATASSWVACRHVAKQRVGMSRATPHAEGTATPCDGIPPKARKSRRPPAYCNLPAAR